MEEWSPLTMRPGCTALQLRSFVERTSLAGHLRYFNKSASLIGQVARHFRRLMRGISFWELDRTQSLLTGLCMLILTKECNKDRRCHKRCNLLVRFMKFVDCVTPMNAHLLIEKLLADLEEHAVDHKANILFLAVQLAELGHSGRVLAVCLLWSLLGRLLPALEITMHRYRELGELAEAIKKTPPPIPEFWLADAKDKPLEVAKKRSLLVLLEAMETLLSLLLRCDNNSLLVFGYPEHFFTIEDYDGAYLTDWCIEVATVLPECLSGPCGNFGGPLHNLIGMLTKRESQATPPAVEEPMEVEGVESVMVEVEISLDMLMEE